MTIHVLHIITTLCRGGAERQLVNLVCNTDPQGGQTHGLSIFGLLGILLPSSKQPGMKSLSQFAAEVALALCSSEAGARCSELALPT